MKSIKKKRARQRTLTVFETKKRQNKGDEMNLNKSHIKE